MKQKVQIVIRTHDSALLLKVNQERGGFWQNITGGVEENEDLIPAATREIKEETGFASSQYRLEELTLSFSFKSRWGDLVEEHCFVAILDDMHLPQLSEEHQDFCWKKIEEIKREDFQYETNYQAFQASIKV